MEQGRQRRVGNGTPSPSESEEGQSFRIGEYLARQRQLRGFTLEELEEITRIPKRSLERLEAGAFDGEDDGFARGFVRTVARALGLDPEETTLLMLSEPTPTETQEVWLARELRLAVLGVVTLLLALGVWLTRDPATDALPTAQPEEVWVRHDAVRALAKDLGVRSGPSPAPIAPIRPSPQEVEADPITLPASPVP
ncbi:MAG: helix-turn-helix domain-containing protein [Deltaproteobacteria bacterium]|nr:helix-turn-helix domain-containing protein [Deltaproteobacteria bacterium]